jgi:hypothetical protein
MTHLLLNLCSSVSICGFFFADAAPTPTFGVTLALVLAGCGALGGIGSFGTMLLMRGRQKVGVSFDFEPASKAEFDKHVADDKEEQQKLTAAVNELRASLDNGRKDSLEEARQLHKRINELLAAICRLEGKLQK